MVLPRPPHLTPALIFADSVPWDELSTLLPLISGHIKTIEPKIHEYGHVKQAVGRSYPGLHISQIEKAAVQRHRKVFPQPDS